jgi:ATP-dependent helicase/nuclease subunit A
MAIDFKTAQAVPERPEDIAPPILAQLGAYLSALRQIFPAERVEVAVLWTRLPRLMVVPDEMVIAALAASTTS